MYINPKPNDQQYPINPINTIYINERETSKILRKTNFNNIVKITIIIKLTIANPTILRNITFMQTLWFAGNTN